MAPRPSEFQLIAGLFAPLATTRNALGLKDDAATLPQKAGHDIVVTADAIVSGVHFLDADPADTVAQKALRVNLSDLAAKGATPAAYLMTLALPPSTDVKWLRAFADGLSADQKTYGITLLGGDTTGTPGPLTISITAFGHVPKGKMLHRSRARTGDLLFVTGSIGDAAGGLAVLKGEGRWLSHAVRDHLIHRYRTPQPRTALAKGLLGIASASIDVSDGLIADVGHIAETSGKRIVIDIESVPRSAALHGLWGDGRQALLKAISGGDDYELAFTAPERHTRRIMALSAKTGVSISRIGHVEKGEGVALRDSHGKPVKLPKASGWTHF
ncbi:MAG TPA: thiamine-phosphate kinase [Rhizomicrobium sp.]|jgi:thiamine-monophosphate kinase|nr:thiamine-phosphate kinase [Rhizomicrobium sp.]